MTKIEDLAAAMNVTKADVSAFVECLKVWIAKGYNIEQAIERHMAQMNRLASMSHKLPKQEIAEGIYNLYREAA